MSHSRKSLSGLYLGNETLGASLRLTSQGLHVSIRFIPRKAAGARGSVNYSVSSNMYEVNATDVLEAYGEFIDGAPSAVILVLSAKP